MYLFRHGEVSYIDKTGAAVADPTKVCLTKLGESQANLINKNTMNIKFDKIACSGLLRTKQTAAHVTKRLGLNLDIYPNLEEIKGGTEKGSREIDINKDIAYHFENISSEEDKFFAMGENYNDCRERVINQIQLILKEDWNCMAIILHGGINAILLSWILGIRINGAALFDQVPGCMNIIDFDLNALCEIKRKTIRAINVPPDLYSSELTGFTSWEKVAKEIEPFFKN